MFRRYHLVLRSPLHMLDHPFDFSSVVLIFTMRVMGWLAILAKAA